METYKVQFGQGYKIVGLLVLPPVLVVLLLAAVAIYLPRLPDWVVVSLIAGLLALNLGLVLYMVKKVSPEVLVTIEGAAVRFTFTRSGAFIPLSFQLPLSDLQHFKLKFTSAGPYIRVRTWRGPGNFSISAASRSAEDLTVFLTLVGELQNSLGRGPATATGS